MKKITFVTQFPPPIHGLSKAVDTLYRSRLKNVFHFEAIDITRNKAIFSTLWKLISGSTDAYYFTISQTKMGLWRDIALMGLMEWKRKPLIIHLHGGYLRKLLDEECGSFERKLAYKAIGKASRCIVLGNSLKPIFQGIVPDEKIMIVPNCADDEYMMQEVTAKMKELTNASQLNVLYLSNLIATKGYREVLECARLLKERGQDEKFVFHFAGKFFDASEQAYFESFVEKHQLKDRIVYHGIVSGQAKTELLEQCHIFMLLTRYPKEGQPISILEAMGNGMAVITTDHAGIPEIASHDNGFACSKLSIDVNEIYGYLMDCYEHREKLADVCMHNYREVKAKYTERQYIDNMDEIFSAI